MNSNLNSTDLATIPKVSVVIPCWNSASTLSATLNSLLAQELVNWECLIVDDGSNDDTPNLIKQISAKDPRFSFLQTKRLGPSNARNLASIEFAKGEYLAFLDSDDLWLPQKLSRTVEQFEKTRDLDISYAKIAFFSDNPDCPETYSTVYSNALKPIDFLRDNPICTMSNLVIRTEVFKKFNGFDASIVHNEDVEFLVRASAGGARIEGINEHFVCYRTSVSGLSSDLKAMRAGWYKALQSLQNTDCKLTSVEISAANAGNLRYLSRRALRTGAPGLEALKLALQGIHSSPKSFFNPVWRGSMTLVAAVATLFLPLQFRKMVFKK